MKKFTIQLTIVSISFLVIAFAFTLQVNAEIDLESAMGIWLLNEGDGNTINDSSGNENHGDLQGGKWVDGPNGSALSLNGINDRVIIPDSDSLYAAEAWTITAWVFVNNAENGYGHIVGKRAAGGAIANYAFRTSPDGKQWDAYFSRGGWKGIWRQGAAKKNTWVYMTAIYDGVDTITIYENGEEIGSGGGLGGPAPRDTEQVNIGGWTNKTSETLNGMLYDVAVFNAAISVDDIKDLMDNGIETLLPVEPTGKIATTWGSIKSR